MIYLSLNLTFEFNFLCTFLWIKLSLGQMGGLDFFNCLNFLF